MSPSETLPRENGHSETSQRDEPFLSLNPEAFGLSKPLSDDIALMDRLLGATLRAQGEDALLALARRLYADADAAPDALVETMPELEDPEVVRRLLRAYTVLFQLINTAQQKEIIRVNRVREAKAGDVPRSESIADAVTTLHAGGMGAEAMQALLDRLEISPTLTAHPTEARRRSVLDKLQSIAQALAERGQPTDAPRLGRPLTTVGLADRELARILTALWQTDELRTTPITVRDEVRNALYFFEHTILDVVAWLHDDLDDALAKCYPGHSFRVPPFLQFRSWVGGDRDGNPNVTPEVTWITLVEHKRLALKFYRGRVAALEREFTQSSTLVPVSDTLMRSLEADQSIAPLPETYLARYAVEPYKLKLRYIEARLAATLDHLDTLSDFRSEGASFAAQPPAYPSATALLYDLRLLQQSLRENHGADLADGGALAHLVTQVTAFGFRLATLDVRQHSEEQERALESLFQAAGVLPTETPYSGLAEADKVTLLTREIGNPRPLLGRGVVVSDHARGLLDVFSVVRHAQKYLSPPSVTAFIISMTHGISDILEVLLLAKEEGLVRWTTVDGERRLESDLDVVPLFETIEDLDGCGALMQSLFGNETYRLQIAARDDLQEIMLGYSDSSKDGGYLAANWALHATQERLAGVCRAAGIELRLFHGRGGTVGRGGGRANQAILSQPAGSFNGRIRFTEQGEVISYRYSLPPFAHRHLEQITHAVLLSAAEANGEGEAVPEAWRAVITEMADVSRRAYRALVYDDPDFWTFYTQATPIAHISRLPIGSRPTRRPGGKAAGLESLRAIPWVFAWVQSRYVLPGWYGLGGGLEAFSQGGAENAEVLKAMYAGWPFFRTVVDAAQLELLRAHLPTAAWYAARVRPAAVGERFHAEIAHEYERTRDAVLALTGQDRLLQNAETVRRMVELRNPAVFPLSKLQVALMDTWDHHALAAEEAGPAWRDAILLSITGIAAAMQSTG